MKREYKESVLKKSFIIITILMPVIMIALGIVPSMLLTLESQESIRINVLDETGFVYSELANTLKDDTLKDGSQRYLLNRVDKGLQSSDEVVQQQKANLAQKNVEGFLHIPANVLESDEIHYFAKNVANIDVNRQLRNSVRKIINDHRIQKSGLEPAFINELTRPLELRTIKITESGQESERGFAEEYFGTFIFVLILYMTIILHGNSIMRSIIEEKTTRIIEVLLSSSNPFQLMAGKILGMGSVGLTQYIIWASFGIGLILFGGNILPISKDYFNFSPMIFIYFVIFYILGYFVFAAMYAAIGSISNSEQEAQQVGGPVVFLLIIPLMILGLLVKNPDSTLVTAMSLIPFFSPILMFARINLTAPGFLQIASAIVILALTILVLIWLTSKIYRIGILMYGKRPNLPEIIKWIRHK